MSRLDEIENQVADWGEETFPDATRGTILAHFAEEAIELVGVPAMLKALAKVDVGMRLWPGATPEESADCHMILFHLARKDGFNTADEIEEKFGRCKRRNWAMSDRGYVKHVDEVGK